MPRKSFSISFVHLRFVKFQLNKGKWSKMTLRICLFAVNLFEYHSIKVDRAELLSLSILSFQESRSLTYNT